jgi:hypothetical protein
MTWVFAPGFKQKAAVTWYAWRASAASHCLDMLVSLCGVGDVCRPSSSSTVLRERQQHASRVAP